MARIFLFLPTAASTICIFLCAWIVFQLQQTQNQIDALKLETKESLGRAESLAAWTNLATIAAGSSGKERAIEILNRAGERLPHLDLSCQTHARLESYESECPSTVGVILQGLEAPGVHLVFSDLREVDLRFANLSDANLSFTNLRGALMSGANLREAEFFQSNLSSADMSAANLYGTSLPNAFLINTDFSRSNLEGATFWGSNM